MRIAINGILLSGDFSGVEKTIYELVNTLRTDSPHIYHLFLPHHSEVNIEESPQFHIHKVDLFTKTRTARIFWEHVFLPGLARKNSCELLHCPGYILPFNCSLPSVLTIHDCFAINHPEWCKISNRLYFRTFMARSIKNATQIIVPSAAVKEELIKTFGPPEDKLNVIPFAPSSVFSPIEESALLNDIRQKYSLDSRFFFFVGNHEPKKNIPGILHAFADFTSKTSSSHKLLLGGAPGWGPAVYPFIKKLQLEKKVICPGYIPLQNLPALYSAADAFLFPSLSEGFGLPILEAMACGTPVITSDRGAAPEVAGNAAILCNPDDHQDIASAMTRIVENKELQVEYSRKGLTRASEFTWAKSAKATEQVYEKVLA